MDLKYWQSIRKEKNRKLCNRIIFHMVLFLLSLVSLF